MASDERSTIAAEAEASIEGGSTCPRIARDEVRAGVHEVRPCLRAGVGLAAARQAADEDMPILAVVGPVAERAFDPEADLLDPDLATRIDAQARG